MKEQYRQNIKIVYLYWDSGRFREVLGGFGEFRGDSGGSGGSSREFRGGFRVLQTPVGFPQKMWSAKKSGTLSEQIICGKLKCCKS